MLKKIKTNSFLFTILIVAVIFRLPLLNGSFWMDEAAQALEIIRPLYLQLDIIQDFQPPLLHLILHFAQYFSRTEIWLRLVGALIPGVLTIFFSYKIAQNLFNTKVAIISSLLLTTSSFHIFYSQELRPYSLPAFLAILSWHLLIQNEKKYSWKSILPYSFVTLLGLYSSYLYPFLILSQFFYSIYLSGRDLSKFLKSMIIPTLGFLPWIPMFLEQLSEGGMVRKNLPGWDQVVSIPQLKAIPLVFAKFIYGVVNIEPNALFVLTSILIAFTSVYLTFKYVLNSSFNFTQIFIHRKKNKNLGLIIIWILIPILTAWLISFIVPVVRPKRLLFLMPPFYIYISYLVDAARGKFAKKAAMILLITLFSLNLIGTFLYYGFPKYQRENWKALYNQISNDFDKERTITIYSFPDKFAPIEWYDTKDLPAISTGYLSIKQVPDLANTLKKVVDYDTVLVFDYLRDLSDPDRQIEKELINFGFEEIGALDYPNIGFVRVFIKPSARIGMN